TNLLDALGDGQPPRGVPPYTHRIPGPVPRNGVRRPSASHEFSVKRPAKSVMARLPANRLEEAEPSDPGRSQSPCERTPHMLRSARLGKRFRDGSLVVLGVTAIGLAVFFALHEPRERPVNIRLTAGQEKGTRHRIALELRREAARRDLFI